MVSSNDRTATSVLARTHIALVSPGISKQTPTFVAGAELHAVRWDVIAGVGPETARGFRLDFTALNATELSKRKTARSEAYTHRVFSMCRLYVPLWRRVAIERCTRPSVGSKKMEGCRGDSCAAARSICTGASGALLPGGQIFRVG